MGRMLKISYQQDEFSSGPQKLLQMFLCRLKKADHKLMIQNDSLLSSYCKVQLEMKNHTSKTTNEVSNHVTLLCRLLQAMRKLECGVERMIDVIDHT